MQQNRSLELLSAISGCWVSPQHCIPSMNSYMIRSICMWPLEFLEPASSGCQRGEKYCDVAGTYTLQ